MRAPAKLNLCLYLGPTRDDGLHELRSLFQPLALADRIGISARAATAADEVRCPGVEGPNLASTALAALRAAGWEGSALLVEIEKRIPVAAGLGGGSADAAAVLRLGLEQLGAERVAGLARGIGADVASQIEPTLALVGGAGELVEPLPPPGEWAAVLIPDRRGLSTPAVFAAADRLGLGREPQELGRIGAELRAAAVRGASPLEYPDLLVNDLTAAATSLLPDIELALEALRESGAGHVLMTGSGPTAVGLFSDLAAADAAASALPHRYAGAIVTGPERWVESGTP